MRRPHPDAADTVRIKSPPPCALGGGLLFVRYRRRPPPSAWRRDASADTVALRRKAQRRTVLAVQEVMGSSPIIRFEDCLIEHPSLRRAYRPWSASRSEPMDLA